MAPSAKNVRSIAPTSLANAPIPTPESQELGRCALSLTMDFFHPGDLPALRLVDKNTRDQMDVFLSLRPGRRFVARTIHSRMHGALEPRAAAERAPTERRAHEFSHIIQYLDKNDILNLRLAHSGFKQAVPESAFKKLFQTLPYHIMRQGLMAIEPHELEALERPLLRPRLMDFREEAHPARHIPLGLGGGMTSGCIGGIALGAGLSQAIEVVRLIGCSGGILGLVVGGVAGAVCENVMRARKFAAESATLPAPGAAPTQPTAQPMRLSRRYLTAAVEFDSHARNTLLALIERGDLDEDAAARAYPTVKVHLDLSDAPAIQDMTRT